MALEKEWEFYQAHKDELLRHYKGQFVLIKDDNLLGTYTLFPEAFDAGVRLLGNQPFLIQQVTETEEVIQYPSLTVGMINADP